MGPKGDTSSRPSRCLIKNVKGVKGAQFNCDSGSILVTQNEWELNKLLTFYESGESGD